MPSSKAATGGPDTLRRPRHYRPWSVPIREVHAGSPFARIRCVEPLHVTASGSDASPRIARRLTTYGAGGTPTRPEPRPRARSEMVASSLPRPDTLVATAPDNDVRAACRPAPGPIGRRSRSAFLGHTLARGEPALAVVVDGGPTAPAGLQPAPNVWNSSRSSIEDSQHSDDGAVRSPRRRSNS